MICDNCDRERVRIHHITRTYDEGEDLLVIENVPIISCPNCSESYLTAETVHQIDRIMQHRREFAVRREVEVVEFVTGN
ncbi:MAG: type II toxin-antitoxin system MqsA family antitoxin [Candidatus Hatepunaea meridiana]|nr:type II toxin-antitoxin system MqsA family antitoxin [Candidatus Hatepunaea meridiana]